LSLESVKDGGLAEGRRRRSRSVSCVGSVGCMVMVLAASSAMRAHCVLEESKAVLECCGTEWAVLRDCQIERYQLSVGY